MFYDVVRLEQDHVVILTHQFNLIFRLRTSSLSVLINMSSLKEVVRLLSFQIEDLTSLVSVMAVMA